MKKCIVFIYFLICLYSMHLTFCVLHQFWCCHPVLWSGSRTFKPAPAPAKMSRLRLHNTGEQHQQWWGLQKVGLSYLGLEPAQPALAHQERLTVRPGLGQGPPPHTHPRELLLTQPVHLPAHSTAGGDVWFGFGSTLWEYFSKRILIQKARSPKMYISNEKS